MARKRKSISKHIRFEVFKRDRFTCQYCGKKAPDAVLHVDHIHPVSDGGDNNIMNLITACQGCNIGKSNRKLDSQDALNKQRAQMESMAERREQIEMMQEWRRDLIEFRHKEIEFVADYFEKFLRNVHLNDTGRRTIQKQLLKFSFDEVVDAVEIACLQYLEDKSNGDTCQYSADKALNMIGGICYNRRKESGGES